MSGPAGLGREGEQTMGDTLGFGLLGAGLVAPFHAKSIQASRGGRLVAVCDVNRQRAEKLAREYDAKVHASLEAMLADPEIRVVNVVTPNHLHHDAVLACARAGKHVIVEKPPAMSLAETDDMINACAEAGVKLAVTVQCRVRRAIQEMKKALDAGRFGRLLHADAYMKWFRTTEYYHSDPWRSSRRSGAGVTVQHAFHYIDLLQYLAGPAARVEAKMTNLAHPSVQLAPTRPSSSRTPCSPSSSTPTARRAWSKRPPHSGRERTCVSRSMGPTAPPSWSAKK